MGYKSDIEIAQETTMSPITEIAAKAGIDPKYLEQYGNYKAKIDYNLLRETEGEDGSACKNLNAPYHVFQMFLHKPSCYQTSKRICFSWESSGFRGEPAVGTVLLR